MNQIFFSCLSRVRVICWNVFRKTSSHIGPPHKNLQRNSLRRPDEDAAHPLLLSFLLTAVMTESPDADDVGALRTHWPVQTGVCVGSTCQLHAAGVWPRRKEAARGQTLCQLIVQRVGRAGGRVACLGARASPRPTLFWHFGKGKRQNKMIQFKLV